MSPVQLSVEWSARFRLYMTLLRKHADVKPRGAHKNLLEGLERVSRKLVEPGHCFAPHFALSRNLRGVLRYKLGRGRLFFIASAEKKLAIILYFGETRRAGDHKRDAYAEFSKLVRTPEFDKLFAKLGLEKPPG